MANSYHCDIYMHSEYMLKQAMYLKGDPSQLIFFRLIPTDVLLEYCYITKVFFTHNKLGVKLFLMLNSYRYIIKNSQHLYLIKRTFLFKGPFTN